MGTTPRTGVTPSPADLESLHLLINGYRVSQAIAVVARLGIADLLTDGPREIDELAALTATHGPSLGRVLRLLAGAGLFEEVAPRRFALTPFGAGLRTDVPGSRHSTALLLDSAQWQAWDDLLYSVQTGETAWEHAHGMSQYDYYQARPTAGATFQQAMTARLEGAAAALVDAYDFCRFERIVDVGGGQGGLLAAVLQACPSARGVVFDRPEVVAGAPALLERAGVSQRCEVVGGDFLEAVPSGGDAYLLRQVIHDWADPPARAHPAQLPGGDGAGRPAVGGRASDHGRPSGVPGRVGGRRGDARRPRRTGAQRGRVPRTLRPGGFSADSCHPRRTQPLRRVRGRARLTRLSVLLGWRAPAAGYDGQRREGEKLRIPGMTSFLNQTRSGTATCRVVSASGPLCGGARPAVIVVDIVPEECVADRGQVSHKVKLFDMHMKYADVVPLADVISYLPKAGDVVLPGGVEGDGVEDGEAGEVDSGLGEGRGAGRSPGLAVS